MRIFFTVIFWGILHVVLAQDNATVDPALPASAQSVTSPPPKPGLLRRAISKETSAQCFSIATGLQRADYWFRLQLPRREHPVNLCLYDEQGRLLTRLYSEERLAAGCHLSNWQIPETLGGKVFYILQIGAHWQTGQLE